jgi:hypothetical protein
MTLSSQLEAHSFLLDLLKLYIISTLCFLVLVAHCLMRPSLLLLILFSMLVHTLLHFPESFLHALCCPVNRYDKIKHQFISHIKQEGIKKKP